MLSLRTKIMAVAALLILLTQVGTVATVLFTAHQSVADRAASSLEAGADILEQTMRSRGVQLGNTVNALAADFAFKQAVATGDQATLESALRNHANRAGASMALLLASDGSVIAGTSADASMTEAAPELVDSAERLGIGRNALVRGETAYDAITVPVRAPLPIAWVVMGFAVTNSYAETLAALTGLEVALVAKRADGHVVIASSVAGDSPGHVDTAFMPASSTGPTTAYIGGVEHLLIARQVLSGKDALLAVMTRSMDEAMAPYRILQTAAFVLGTLPLVFALAGAALLSRALTRPVQRLLRATQRIQAGDYSRPVDIRSGDELGQFASAFNSMQTEISRREAEITRQARHDSLTGLPNRDAMLVQIAAEIDRAAAAAYPLALAVLDLNGLGEIGPAFGHDVADTYVQQAARQLQAACGEPYPLARLERDSFLLVLPRHDAARAHAFVEQVVSRLASGIELRGMCVTVRPSVGIAAYPEHGSKHDQLLLRATIAQSESRSGLNPIAQYLEGDEQRRLRRMTILGDLRQAITEDRLELHYQPKVAPADGMVRGAEALVRWEHPSLGAIPPGDFIPIAEQSGNISLLTRWALRTALRECRAWQDKGLKLSVSVNVSAHDLLDQRLHGFVCEALREYDLHPGKLVLEVTEEALVRDFDQATTVLRTLRELGIGISMDDFGTGYSSLAQLKYLPVNELKIDRSFVRHLPDDAADAAIVLAAMRLARDLRMVFVAEGVETRDAVDWFQQHGAELAQGYYFSRPLPGPEFVEWVRRRMSGETKRMPSLAAIMPLAVDDT